MDPVAAEIAWACGVRLRDAFGPHLNDSVTRRIAYSAEGELEDQEESQTDGAIVVRLAQFAWDTYYAAHARRAAAGVAADPAAERELLEFELVEQVRRYPSLDEKRCRDLTAALVEETLRRADGHA